MSDENETRDRQPEGRRPAWLSGAPRGQERVVSYESDERYWTDYLRVALPVVGLLLMLGLLVWWANSIIGDNQGTQPTSTIPSSSQVSLAQTNTPANTQVPSLTTAAVPTDSASNGTDTSATDAAGTQSPGGDATVTSGNDGETPTPACDGDFADGDAVLVTEDNVRLRKAADVGSDILDELAADTPLTIISSCYTEAADGKQFWRVADENSGLRGYVSGEFLKAAP